MAKMNPGFLNLKKSYLFIEIGKRVREYIAAHPDNKIIKMGIGDVTQPLAPVVVAAMKKAADEMGVKETFRGYEDSGKGYDFLREAVAGYYKSFGVTISPEEVLISDGAKSDCGNIGDIFSENEDVVVTDPAYPVYVDSNVMGGRTVHYVNSTEDNGFAAMPDESMKPGLIYLCSPNNPTGSVYTKEQLKVWVDYAIKNKSVIIFDAAYEAFISDETLPRSIFQIEGARRVCYRDMLAFQDSRLYRYKMAVIPLSPRSLCLKLPQAKKSALCSYGAEDREASSTAFPILFSVPLRLYSQRKATSRQELQ